MARAITRAQAHRISQRLLRRLGAKHRGELAAVEMRTGEAYVGATSLAAVEAGLRAHPRGQFYIERLGYEVAGMMKPLRSNDSRDRAVEPM
jgi:hypothetical protein